jgi:plasmid maintenance system antidote protein VapI
MTIKANVLSQKDYERLCCTPQEVCEMISDDFKLKGISRREAAGRLGVQAPVVTIQLSGKKYFGKRTAEKYSLEFGYNPVFLKTGIGYLNMKPQLDARLSASRGPSARVRNVTSSYIRYTELRSQLDELKKEYENAVKERDRAIKSLNAEKQRNEKLNIRIEKLMDKLEVSPAAI